MQKKDDLSPKMGSQAPMTSSFTLEMMEKMEKDEEKK